jgi:HAD superfamily hydrolase (TIGR01549 family)
LVTGPITTLTFDFWNTIYSADGGAMDLVRPRRMEALRRMLGGFGVDPSDEQMLEAYRSGFDAYMAAWTQGLHYGARDQVGHILTRFEVVPRPEDEELLAETALGIEEASLLAPLQPLPGALETVPALRSAGYRLGLISDTSLTPGRILKKLLAGDGLLSHFEALTFSDETGYTKPDPRMFQQTLAPLGAKPAEAAHVGDTPRTDIAGAKNLGMVAIRCAGAVDHTEPPDADFVIKNHREIPDILASLS